MGGPTPSVHQKPRPGPFTLSLPSQETRQQQLSGRSRFQTDFPDRAPAMPHPPWGSHVARSAAQRRLVCSSAWLPKFVPENSSCILKLQILRWLHVPLSQLVSPSSASPVPPSPGHRPLSDGPCMGKDTGIPLKLSPSPRVKCQWPPRNLRAQPGGPVPRWQSPAPSRHALHPTLRLLQLWKQPGSLSF